MEPLESDTMPDAPALVVLTVMLAVVVHYPGTRMRP